MRHDGRSYQSQSGGGEEKWSASGYILKVEPMEFLYKLDGIVCESEGSDISNWKEVLAIT